MSALRGRGNLALWVTTVALFLAVLAYTLRGADVPSLLANLSGGDLLLSCLVGLVFHLTQGVLLRFMFEHQHGVLISRFDTATLPLMMHLWTYLIPAKGGLIFQTFFLRLKYGLALAGGFSIGIFSFLLSLVLSGGVGLALSATIETGRPALQAFFASLLAVPLLVLLLGALWQPAAREGHRALAVLVRFAADTLRHVARYSRDGVCVVGCVALLALNVAVHALWFHHSARALGVATQPVEILSVTLVLRVLYLVRLVPGNLGVQELMTGGVFALVGLTLHDGVLIGLLMRLVSVALSATLGVYALYLNLDHLGLDSFRALLHDLKAEDGSASQRRENVE